MTRAQCNVVGLLIGAFLTPFAVMLFDRRAPVILEFPDEKGEIVPYQARADTVVEVNWPVREVRSCEGEYSRRVQEMEFPGGKIHAFGMLPVVYNQSISKDRKRFSRSFHLPRSIGPGPADYWTVGHRWCNFMQKYFWRIPFESPRIRFEVLPPSRPTKLPRD